MRGDRERREEADTERTRHDNRLVRLVALGAADGVAAGWTALLLLVELDIAEIGTLLKGAEDGPLALAVAAGFFGITFAMLGIAWNVMVILPEQE